MSSEEDNEVLLDATNDDHGGVIVELKDPMDPLAFLSFLRASIAQWTLQDLAQSLNWKGYITISCRRRWRRRVVINTRILFIVGQIIDFLSFTGKRGIWIKLPIELVNLVETVVKEGFHYHHAEPHYLMLVYWIPETTNTIPANASHRVGVGAIILNDKCEEKSGKLQGTGVWKIPTGVVDEGEDITVAAVREVKEETGIDAEFQEVLAFSIGDERKAALGCWSFILLILGCCWPSVMKILVTSTHDYNSSIVSEQAHKSFFEKSDLFFVCMLNPLSFQIQKQDQEIEAAKWMSLEEYAAQPVSQRQGIFKCIHELCLAKIEGNYAGFSPLSVKSIFDDQLSYFYLNRQAAQSLTSSDQP